VFDGTSAYAEAPNSATLDIGGTGFCIAFWAKVISTSSGVDYVLAGKPWAAASMPSPFYQYGVEYSNSSNKTLDFFFGDGASNLHGPYRMSATPAVWTHVAFSYDGSTVKGYIDGVERLSVTDPSGLQPRGHSLRLGVDGAYQQFFNGALDDLRLYSRALTPAEIQSVMQTPVGGVPTNVTPDIDAARAGVLLEARSPFSSTTSISYVLPAAQDGELQVLNVVGRVVCTLAQGTLAAGHHQIEWNGHDSRGREVASGRYFLRLRAGGIEKTTAVVRVR
jgi:concanavalin A-like lectin/glucanase superfamily protein/flagellar hook capping protein FlgD